MSKKIVRVVLAAELLVAGSNNRCAAFQIVSCRDGAYDPVFRPTPEEIRQVPSAVVERVMTSLLAAEPARGVAALIGISRHTLNRWSKRLGLGQRDPHTQSLIFNYSEIEILAKVQALREDGHCLTRVIDHVLHGTSLGPQIAPDGRHDEQGCYSKPLRGEGDALEQPPVPQVPQSIQPQECAADTKDLSDDQRRPLYQEALQAVRRFRARTRKPAVVQREQARIPVSTGYVAE